MDMQSEILELELDAIVKKSKDNIVITDGNGVVLRASPNSYAIYGSSTDDLIGKSVYQLEEDHIFSPSVTIKVLNERKEVRVMQNTKTGRSVMAIGLPIFDRSNEIIRVISFSHDLTEIEQLKEEFKQLQKKIERYETEIQELRDNEQIEGNTILKSKAIQQIWQLIKRVAKTDASVVFLGESGVGKTHFARALHQASERANEAFIDVNCSAIPESLFESEMFGYEPGSFTGASKKGKTGIIELADQGTLFLDEIGEIPLSMQSKLLKVIQDKEVIRIGGVRPKKVDFRLITSTNQNLSEMIKHGSFRQDLFYRLSVISITIPPLRERKEDIAMLAYYYLQKFNEKYRMRKSLHPATIDKLIHYHWPGNVRELQNTMERLVITSETNIIHPDNLPSDIQMDRTQKTDSLLLKNMKGKTLREAMEEVEILWLRRAVKQCKTTYEMAEFLGISQSNVVRKLKKYRIKAKPYQHL
ncbi:sigma-54 interaction domain-containing protein [Bacillus smithii]|uniref:sigma-54 interaction domain-containing protein n=1 Tax=Bacillus smithii TaxID=1479 RepID=UPI002E21E04D|nr:sigma 54-interacting transcriptional regulator [Bacillus smithii]MED1454991.1 sigma 54-interacting transcriptional regulator [Bacillus smithii]